jgi:hypothetical protein
VQGGYYQKGFAKHGALSSPGGRLEVVWTEGPSARTGWRRLEMLWTETGGPDIERYPTPGAGTDLVRDFVREVLGGEVEIAYPRGGAFHRVVLQLGEEPEPQTPVFDGNAESAGPIGAPTGSQPILESLAGFWGRGRSAVVWYGGLAMPRHPADMRHAETDTCGDFATRTLARR